MIKTYSKSAQGNQMLSANFKVGEFACNDGSDLIKIDDSLVQLLQQIRVWACGPVRINSGYRTPAYNARVGGASESYHTKGQAADVAVTGKTPAEVAKFAQAVGAGGIGLYDSKSGHFVHIDTRQSKYLWTNTAGSNNTASSHGGACPYIEPEVSISRGNYGIQGVKWLQWYLNIWGDNLAVDGSFGPKTEDAVTQFQARMGLPVDGLAGTDTKNALKGIK